MSKKITNIQVVEFLTDYAKDSEIILLEEGKEKSELEKIAEARGIKIKGSRDLAVFKTVYAFTDRPNSNGAILPKKELLKILPQIIGKPINKNHNRSHVLGTYIDYRYLEKSHKIIAYGIFFKACFPTEWEAAQNLFKNKKLSTSFEIWSNRAKEVKNEQGEYELMDMEISGGALIYQDDENFPAFKDASVLAFAKENVEKMELVYASKHKEDEIITCKDGICTAETAAVDVKDTKTTTPLDVKPVENTAPTSETPVKLEEQTPIQPTITKIKCSNCTEEFEISGYDTNIKCPKCKAIVNQKGEMIHPPQIVDFGLLCQSCKVNNWLILSNKEDTSKIRCLNCAKEYKITFKQEVSGDKKIMLDKVTFLYTGTATCIQCGNGIVFEGSSKQKQREFTCSKCGLIFTHDITKANRKRTIASIKEMEVKLDKELIKSKKEGGKTMELDKKEVKKATEEKKEVKAVEKETPKAEVKVKTTETPAKKPSKETAPKAEEKVGTKPVEKPKAEVKEEVKDKKITEPSETTKTDKMIKEETILADMEYEAELKKKEDVNELTISKVARFAKLDDKFSNIETAIKKDSSAKELTLKERKSLSDNEYAIVVTIKNKKTGKERKVRRFPINDRTHIRNALYKLSQPETLATLEKLGADIKSIRGKIIAQAKNIVKTSLIKKRKDEKVNAEKKITTLTKQLEESKKQVELYKTNAKTLISRREELGDYANEMKDEDLLNEDKFERAKLEKEKSLTIASEVNEDDIVGSAKKDNDYYVKIQDEIDEIAFKKPNKKE